MVTTTSISIDSPTVPYRTLVERVVPFLNNRAPDEMLIDTVRDAVIQVCRDLDFLRTSYEFDVNTDDRTYTLNHQGFSFSNPIRAWADVRDSGHLLPSRVFDDTNIKLNETEIIVPEDLTRCISDKIFFLISLAPNRNSTDFPATVYDQEAELLIMRARTLLREFDPNPLPESAYREKVGRAYSRYMSTLGEETIEMYI